MNRGYLVAAVGAAVLVAAAYITRYEPLPGGAPMGLLPLWDRWFHQVCFVIFAQDNRIACSADALSGKSGSAESSKAVVVGEIKKLREAGFTDKEIVDHVLEQPR